MPSPSQADTLEAGHQHTLLSLAAPYRSRMLVFALSALAVSAAILTQAYTLSQVLTRVFLEGAALPDVQTLLLLFAAASILRGLLVWASELAALLFAGRIKSDLRTEVLAHLASLGPAWLRTQRSGELVNTLTGGVEALEAYFNQFLPQLSRATLIPLGIVIVVFSRDFTSGLVLLLTAPLIPLFMILIGNLAEGVTRRQWQTMSHLSAHFLDVLQGLLTLKIFNRAREQVEVIRQISSRYRETTMAVLRVAFLSALVLEMLATLSTALVAVQIGVRLLNGTFQLQTAFFILFLAPEFYQPLRSLGSSFHTGTAGRSAAARIFEILQLQPATITHRASQETALDGTAAGEAILAQVGALLRTSFPAVTVENVSFRYEPERSPALHEVSFTLQPGEITALIGPSGAGKTTITQLLLRFLQPAIGRILVGDTPLQQIEVEDWRRQVAWVSQAPYFFQGSIADNIRLGAPRASQQEVREAAAQAQLLEFIASLPNGFDTPVGEQGARLSGGQAQRVALARAFLRDAPLLILDEPTANLDPRIEEELLPVLASLAAHRTVLLISHRLQTILPAGQLLVLQHGQLVEQGKPVELQCSEGPYARLLAQARSQTA